MCSVHVCFHLNSLSLYPAGDDTPDKRIQTVYKPLAKFLYAHPEFPFSMSVNAELLQILKKRRNELIAVLKEMAERNQLEITGGAYHNAPLPLLFPADRSAQIETLSTEIRQAIGKRPRGMTIFADAWDSSLIGSLSTNGMEYVILDSSVIRGSGEAFLGLVMSELGKSVEIFPSYSEFIPKADTEPKDFIQMIKKAAGKSQKKSRYIQMEPNRMIVISLEHEQILPLIEGKFFERLSDYLAETQKDAGITLSTPGIYRKSEIIRLPVYIPCGINGRLSAQRAYNPATQSIPSFQNYLEHYAEGFALYRKIIFTNTLVNQYKGDKIRKKCAREKLYLAQEGGALIWNPADIPGNIARRQAAYKNLIEAEKILAEDSVFRETITSFDYDFDGLNEYVCRMRNFFIIISLVSGAMTELDVLKGGGNYADNMSLREQWDGEDDRYHRGIFVDHVLSEAQFARYAAGKSAGDGVFSRIHYTEEKYSQSRREIQMSARAVTSEGQSIFLRKKYVISTDGLYVQYILRNESSRKIALKFAVESNLALVSADAGNGRFKLELIDGDEKITADENFCVTDAYSKGKLRDVTTVQITDIRNSVSFVFEPNETCGYFFRNIEFKRPDLQGSLRTAQTTLVSTLFWDIELEPGMETEKNINLAIFLAKKAKKS